MPDLFIRHVRPDQERAGVLASALEAFGYVVSLRDAPFPEDENPVVLALWSPTSINDDAMIWELAGRVRSAVDRAQSPRVYQAKIEAVAARIDLNRTCPMPDDRLFFTVDLSDWSGAPNDDRLAPLIWQLPSPATPHASPPLTRPASRDEARWRGFKAQSDVAALANFLRISRRDSRKEADAQHAHLEELRSIGANPEAWRRYGPMTFAAATAGPAALRAWAQGIAEDCLLPDPDAPSDAYGIGRVASILFAIDVCAGVDRPHAFSRDLRSQQEMLGLIEAGDVAAMDACRRDFELSRAAAPALERLAKTGSAPAMHALSTGYTVPDYRRRVLLEKAAALDYAPALRDLAWQCKQRGKHRLAIETWRRGAALGDRFCKEELARALDAGKHVERAAAAAFALFTEIVSDWGDPHIALRMAQMRWDGDGVARDRDAAVRAFFDLHIGDEAPYAVAVHIGDLYRDGLGGLEQDREEAMAWYRGAAFNGDVPGLVARQRLSELGALSDGDTSDEPDEDELDPEEREQMRNFWRPHV
jgi:TPR repeat protein